MVLLEWVELKRQILNTYDVEDVLNALQLDVEDILDAFPNKVYENLENFNLQELDMGEEE